MAEPVIVALIAGAASLITGGFTLVGVLISNGTRQAVTDTKLEELTREVREHNDFARRMPAVEAQVTSLDRRIEKIEKELHHV